MFPPPTASTQQPKPAQQPANPTQEIAKEQPEGPALAAGSSAIRLGGYLGVTGIYRSTNSGGGPGTNFATIPYEDIVQGNVSETRLSAQTSRISLRVDADFPEPETRFRRLSGYFEMDFSGTTPGTVAVTSTSVGFRLRQGFAEVQYRRTLLPGRRSGLHPDDGAERSAQHLAGGHRVVAGRRHQLPGGNDLGSDASSASDVAPVYAHQLGRVGGESGAAARKWIGLYLPACCADDIDAQYNTGSDELRVPNLMTDIVTRVAFNPIKPLHVDVGGVVRVFRHTVSPYDDDFKDVGGGASINAR